MTHCSRDGAVEAMVRNALAYDQATPSNPSAAKRYAQVAPDEILQAIDILGIEKADEMLKPFSEATKDAAKPILARLISLSVDRIS